MAVLIPNKKSGGCLPLTSTQGNPWELNDSEHTSDVRKILGLWNCGTFQRKFEI